MLNRSRLCVIAFSVLTFARLAVAQYTGTEIFITTALASRWDNVVLTRAGVDYTITFDLSPAGPSGAYGPTYDEGEYELQPFWVDASGIQIGAVHITLTGGNPGAYEAHPAMGSDFVGYRFARKDGLPFSLKSMDYRSAASDILINLGPVANAADITTNSTSIGHFGNWSPNVNAWRSICFGYGANQVFFTVDGDCDFDNFVLCSNGVSETIPFDFIGTIGNGSLGPQYAAGSYVFEAFWTTNQGTTAGHTHITSVGGNPGSYEAHHFNGGNDFQGYRVFRPDGARFNLTALDYRDAHSSLMLFSSGVFSTASIIASSTFYGPAEGFQLFNQNWLTFAVGRTPDDGQAPQPGFATLDVNNAKEVCANPVASNLPGPYFATAMAGVFGVRITGAPLNPFLVLVGDLNPGVASISGFGQLDIGFSPAGTGLTLILNGLDPNTGGIYATDALGEYTAVFSVPSMPSGLRFAAQAAVYGAPAALALTNAVEITTL